MTRFASPPALCSTGTGCAVPVAAAATALSVRFSVTPWALAAVAAKADSIEPTRTSVRTIPANFRFILDSPRVKNSRPQPGRLSCSARWSGFNFAPDEIDGNAEQYDHEPRNGLGAGLIRDQQNYRDCRCENDVQSRQNGVADHPVRPLRIRPCLPEPEEADGSERVENERRENHVVEQLPIGPGQAEQAGPDRLGDQSGRRHVVTIEVSSATEKHLVACHRVVHARARENESVVAAESGDQDQ